MEIADALSVLMVSLLVVVFWAAIPGLITGWMLREVGGSYAWGFVFGFVCGPCAVLLALAYIVLAGRTRRAARTHAAPGRALPPRSYYHLPLVGRLHVSTVWALAGIATFMCVWVIGGLAYEFYRVGLLDSSPHPAQQAATTHAQTGGTPAQTADGEALATGENPALVNMNGAGRTAQQPRTSALAGIGVAPTQAAPMTVNAPLNSALSGRDTALASTTSTGAGGAAIQPQTQTTAQAQLPAPMAATTEATAVRVSVQARDAAISDLTRTLSSRGYKVHAAVSGDAQTTTLSLSCATLTRDLGNQLFGNRRTRETMKAAGIRIVVIINGDESWTYIL